MRGTSYYQGNRLAVRELDKNYIAHRERLNNLKYRKNNPRKYPSDYA